MVCGDGKIDPHEECDDGNDIPYDGCTRCLVDAFFTCGGEPSFCVRLAAGLEGCGNGKLEKGEECDDGNGLDGDGCSYRCEVEPGYMCNGAGPCRHRPPCGDGIIEEGEQCDDGNTTDYDGCNAACQVDHYYTCVGQPSVCTPTIIGSSSSSAEEVQTPNTPVAADASSSAVSFIYTPASSSSASSAYSLSPRRRHYSSVP
jgi:cysteine-rich repeat protein